MKAWVINLEKESARRAQICAQLDAQAIDFEVFPAVDGRQLDDAAIARAYDARATRAVYRELSRGEIGCALSHLGVYRRLIDEGAGHALVLEDDAALGPGLAEALRRIAAAVPAEAADIVLLNHVDKYTRWGSEALGDGMKLVRRYGDWWRAHGYVVTRAAAERMLAAQQPLSAPADYWAFFDRRAIVRVRALVPYCIGLSELAKESSLETHRASEVEVQKAQRGIAYYLHLYGWRRFVFQIFVRPFLRIVRQKQTW